MPIKVDLNGKTFNFESIGIFLDFGMMCVLKSAG
jgi:hypothetical protein